MSTNMVGNFFRSRRDLGVDVVFIFMEPYQSVESRSSIMHELLDWPLISMIPGAERVLRSIDFDVFLLIDYRNNYNAVLDIFPETPVILWARDPRTNKQIENLQGIRFPGDMKTRPRGTHVPKATRAGHLFEKMENPLMVPSGGVDSRRRMLIGVTWLPALRDRLWEAYNIPVRGNAFELPNIVQGCEDGVAIKKSENPSVIFVGRLDPYKRPWLMVELAKMFPEVEFNVLGRRHEFGRRSYDIERDSGLLPHNLKLLGQVTGEEKWRRLAAA